jgi:hypothetical protein
MGFLERMLGNLMDGEMGGARVATAPIAAALRGFEGWP